MRQLIIKILTLHPEGMLGSVIAAMVSPRFKVDKDVVWEALMDMQRKGELVKKPRVFRPGEPSDSDIFFALPSSGVVRVAPNKNPNMQ